MSDFDIKEKISASEVKKHAIKSVKWTALSEIASRSIQPLVILILARLLTPEDFGVVGVAMIAIGLAQIFQDFGLGKTLIQRETEIEKSANIVFWTNLTLSLVIYIIIFLSAPLLSIFFHEPKVIDVLRVLCLLIVLTSLITVHQAFIQRNFQFKQLFFIRLSSAAIPGFISIPLALYGYGVWALVFGTLAGAVVQVLLFWKFSKWRPRLSYDLQLARQLFGFSAWVALEAFLAWLIMWGDSIVLGHFLGMDELGVYRVGVTLLMVVFGIFFNPILPIAYSAFSRLQNNPDELRQSFLKMTKLIASISLPLGVALAIFAEPISSTIFGQKWHGIEIVIAFIGIMHAVAWLVGINPDVYRAVGRPDINSKVHLIQLIWYIPAYVFAAPHGLYVFCIARLTVAIISMFLHMYFSKKLLDIGWYSFLKNLKTVIVSTGLSGLLLVILSNVFIDVNNLLNSIALGVIFILIYIGLIFLKDRDFALNSLRLIKVSIGGK